jgi:hypothetical protein
MAVSIGSGSRGTRATSMLTGIGDRRVVADQADGADAEDPGRLDRDRGEHRLRFGALRDQRRDPAQRPLRFRQAAQFVARLGVRDGRGHQVGEVGQPRLAARRERLAGFPVRPDETPDRAVDQDRGRDGLPEPLYPVPGRDRARELRPVVDPGRPAGPDDQLPERRVGERRLAAVGHRGPRAVGAGDQGEHPRVRVVPDQADGVHADDPRGLRGDGVEQPPWFGALGDQRRDPAQRPLLLGQGPQLPGLGGQPPVQALGGLS